MTPEHQLRIVRKELQELQVEHARVVAQLGRTGEMLQMIMDNMPEFIFWKDKYSRFIGCNRNFAYAMGYEHPEDIIGKTDFDLPTGRDEAEEAFRRDVEVMRCGIPEYHVIESRLQEGEQIWVDTNKIPLFSDGEVVGILCTYEDITDRVHAEKELREHKEKLEQLVEDRTRQLMAANRDLESSNVRLEAASLAKSQFVANISHEIRTPLNGVVAMTELMLDTRVTHVQREYLTAILESTDSLLYTINDLLDYSRMEAGKLRLEECPFDLCEAVESTLKSLSAKAQSKGLEVAVRVDPLVPAMVVGDPLRLRQILVNLLGNAIKFTDQGHILIELASEILDEGGVVVRFTVEDTGVGIAPDRLEAIFQAFEQGDNSTTRRFGGSGLGLAIVSQLVDMMGGGISVESEPGKGSRFRIDLRMRLGAPGEKCRWAELKQVLGGRKVFLLEDRPFTGGIMRETLEELGCEIMIAPSRLAFSRLLDVHGEKPDLVVVSTDLHDGEEYRWLCEKRNRGELGYEVLFLLSGGDGLKRIESEGLLGDSECLFLPVFPFELCEKMCALLGTDSQSCSAGKKGDGSKESGGIRDESVKGLKVLLVDDREWNRKVGHAILTRIGHEVDFASDGLEAVRCWEEGNYDFVLMDIQMPVMDGFEAAKRIRELESQRGLDRLPIIAVTANAMKGEGDRALEAGMDGFVPKPIHIRELQQVIESTLAQVKERQEAKAQKPSSESSTRTTSASVIAGNSGSERQVS